MLTQKLEFVIAKFLNPRVNIIVPNVSWGLGLKYECDLLCVTPQGYATEVELKVSAQDLRADFKKRHFHDSNKIRRFFYGVPIEMKDCKYLPLDCGLIVVDDRHRVKIIRSAKINKKARPLTEKEINKLLHLGCMRVWGLKESLYNRRILRNGKS